MWTSHPPVAWLWSAAGGSGGLIAAPAPQGSGGASLGPFAVAGSVICTSSPPSGLALAWAWPPCALATERRWTGRARSLAGCWPAGEAAERLELPGYLVGGTCSPPLETVISASPVGLGAASTQPPATLCLTALSMRLQTSRSSRTRSPVTSASCSAVLIWIRLAAAAGPIRSMASSTAVGRSTSSARAWSAVGAGQGEQCFDEFLGLVHGGADGGEHRFQVRGGGGWPGRGDVDQGAHLGERGAQLMGGVGDEPALAGERGI